VEHRAQSSGAAQKELTELAEIVQDSLADIRRISHELRPEALDQLGLTNALISLCARVQEQTGLPVRRDLEVVPALSPEVELAIYRIAQEALTNAVRHSGAAAARVSLSRRDRELVLRVSDDGSGLPEDVVESGGLAGMRERAMLIGAELEIDSGADRGVGVTLRLPLG
jgi:two-component system sensor histidine kinase UhpB